MTLPTPGPYEVDIRGREGNANDPWHCAIVATEIGQRVVIADTLNCSCVFSPDDQRANANVLAAGPALRDALRAVLPLLGWTSYSDDELLHEHELGNGAALPILRARYAIAKADGNKMILPSQWCAACESYHHAKAPGCLGGRGVAKPVAR